MWPGTEDRLAAPAGPAAPAPSPAPGSPGVASFGPLGTVSYEEASRQVWEPRRLYKEPLLRPRHRPEDGGPDQRGTRSRHPAAAQPGTERPAGRTESGRVGSGDSPGAAARRPGAARDHGGQRCGPRIQLRPPRRAGRRPGDRAGRRPGDRARRPRDRIADRLRLGDLLADSRMRIWKRRLLVAIVAGLVFTFIFTWRAGLTAAVLAGIADAVYRSRTTASMPPGVRLTGAQKRTQRQLARMERAGYRALHSRPIPGSREFIDHFVVGPTGAYAIDSEAWDKRLPIRTKNARQLWHGPFSKKDRLEHARWEAQEATDRLTAELGTPVYVRPVLAVYGPKVPWHFATIREVDVFDGDRLRKYLRRNATLKDRPKLTSGEVEQIYAAAAGVLPLNAAAQHTPVG